MIESKAKKRSGDDPLERALAEWKAHEAPPERLSAPVRQRILESIEAREWRFERPEALRPVFWNAAAIANPPPNSSRMPHGMRSAVRQSIRCSRRPAWSTI